MAVGEAVDTISVGVHDARAWEDIHYRSALQKFLTANGVEAVDEFVLFEKHIKKKHGFTSENPIKGKLEGVYEDCFFEKSPDSRVLVERLQQAAELSILLLSKRIELPAIVIHGSTYKWSASVEPSVAEGAVEFQFTLHRPVFLDSAWYHRPDDNGLTMADAIGDEIPLWAVRFTPIQLSDYKSGVLIGACQRAMDFYSGEPLRFYKDYFDIQKELRFSGKIDDSSPFETRISLMHKTVDEEIFSANTHRVIRTDEAFLYLLRGAPGEAFIKRMERQVKTPFEDIALLMSMDILKNYGFYEIRACAKNPWIEAHNLNPERPYADAFHYVELYKKYFQNTPGGEFSQYPWKNEGSVRLENQADIKDNINTNMVDLLRKL